MAFDHQFHVPGVFSKTQVYDISDEDQSLESCNNKTEFHCHDWSRCILREMVKDNKQDCADGSDEKQAIECYQDNEFTCSFSGQCLPRYRVNDGFADCLQSTDENVTDFSCFDQTEFLCEEESRCVPRLWVGNSVKDCRSGIDEKTPLKECTSDEFQCLDKTRCLPVKYLCDGLFNCKDASDEIELCFSPRQIPVKWEETTRITMSWFDYFFARRSGFRITYMPRIFLKGFKCFVDKNKLENKFAATLLDDFSSFFVYGKKKRTIPQFLLHENNYSLCLSNEDQCFTEDGKFNCSRCLSDNTIIANTQVCDGYVDCPDLSDECLCLNSNVQPLCNLVYESRDQLVAKTQSICNFYVEMKDGIDENFCYTDLYSKELKKASKFKTIQCKSKSSNETVTARLCDGKVECASREDECQKACIPDGSHSLKKYYKYLNSCFVFLKCSYIFRGTFACYENSKVLVSITLNHGVGAFSILVSYYTNGWNYYYENGFRILLNLLCISRPHDCPWKYFCQSGNDSTIDTSQLCDLKSDCQNGEDELNCSNETHFYCKSGLPKFISKALYGDGKNNCNDTSDECIENDFSSPQEMIKDNILKDFVWVNVFVTIIANVLVCYRHIRKLKKLRDNKLASYINTILLINLALSDLLMGIALLTIAAKSHQFSGNYCFEDYKWRSSMTCNVIGVLTMVSSLTSMNILVLLTAVRLFVTVYPFKSGRMNLKLLRLLLLLSWLIALFLSLLPVLKASFFSKYFLIDNSPFFRKTYVQAKDLKKYFETSNFLLNISEAQSLEATKSFITSEEGKLVFPNRYLKINASFGYYQSNSVCFPDFYSVTSPSFEYSLTLILYNLIALLFIIASYVFIFRRTKQSSASVNAAANNPNVDRKILKLKKRVIYIIATDMCCWLPIIVMAFIAYSGYKLIGIVHPISAIIILPVNSAINPIIYSRLDKLVLRGFNKLFKKENNVRGKPK